jgi:GTP-binding protein HflX
VRRAQRNRRDLPVISIVGYTNAGKSTLLNAITGSEVLAENKLFATLDPTSRRLRFPQEREVIITDTVGFIRDLPKDLVAAFRATLEEVVEADLVLHVCDISHPETEAQRRDVEAVLAGLGIDTEAADAPVLEVWNKADRLAVPALAEAERALVRREQRPVLVSALTGEGIDDLLEAIEARLGAADEILTVEIPARAGGLLSWLHAHAEVLAEEASEETGTVTARVRIDAANRGKFAGQLKRAGLASDPSN